MTAVNLSLAQKKNVLVLLNNTTEYNIIEFYIQKVFGEFIRLFKAHSEEEAFHKVDKQQFDMIIADSEAESVSISNFVYKIHQNELNKSEGLILIGEVKDPSPFFDNIKLKWSLQRPVNHFKLMAILSEHLGLNEVEKYKVAKLTASILEASKGFISQVLFEKSSIGNPELRSNHSAYMTGSGMLFQFSALQENQVYSFLLIFEDSLLEKFAKSIGHDQGYSRSIIAKAATKIIVNGIRDQASKLFDGAFQNQVYRSATDGMIQELKKEKTVFYSVETSFGKLQVHTFG